MQARAEFQSKLRDQIQGTCLLFLILCLGLEHLVETGSSETPRGVEKQDVLLEPQGHTGCNAQAHLGDRDRVSASPHMSLCGTSSPYMSSPLSSTPLTCVFPVPGAPMSSVTSPVYSPESSSWSRLWDGHKVGLSTPLQPEWQEHQEAAVPGYLSLKSPSQMHTSARFGK